MILKMAIIGLGQIGASIGLALFEKRDLIHCTGYDVEPKVMRKASKLGAVDKTTSYLKKVIENADVVLMAIPTNEMQAMMEEIVPLMKEGAILLDTALSKEQVANWAAELLPEGCSYVGLTPVINPDYLVNTSSGIDSARADLFQNGMIAISSPPSTEPKAIKFAADLARLLDASVLFADMLEVDSVMAATHTVPRLMARAAGLWLLRRERFGHPAERTPSRGLVGRLRGRARRGVPARRAPPRDCWWCRDRCRSRAGSCRVRRGRWIRSAGRRSRLRLQIAQGLLVVVRLMYAQSRGVELAGGDVAAQRFVVGRQCLLELGAQSLALLAIGKRDFFGKFEGFGQEHRVELLVSFEYTGALGLQQCPRAAPRIAQDLPGIVDLGGALQDGDAVFGVAAAIVVGVAVARKPKVALFEFFAVEIERAWQAEHGERVGSRNVEHGRGVALYALNEVPQPHVPLAWGFLNTKPRSSSPSLKSSSVPPMKNSLFLSTTMWTPCCSNVRSNSVGPF